MSAPAPLIFSRVPRFVLAPDHDLTLEYPVGMWSLLGSTIGGEIESDASYPASFIVLRNADLLVPVLLTEAEWPAFRELLLAAQIGGAFDWYPDTTQPAISVYLEGPSIDDGFSPEPDGQLLRLLRMEIVLRRADGTAWDLPYFPEEA